MRIKLSLLKGGKSEAVPEVFFSGWRKSEVIEPNQGRERCKDDLSCCARQALDGVSCWMPA